MRYDTGDKIGCSFMLLQIVLVLFLLVGEVKCFVKILQCDWEPIGKAEIIYTAGFFTGTGGIIGWIDIEDEK